MRLVRCAPVLSILLFATGAHADAPLVATRLDAANFASLAPGGVDAIAGLGDVALANGVLCAVISDPSRESDLAPYGGALIDLGHCGRRDDQLVVVHPLANLSRAGAVRVESLTPAVTADEARVEARGRNGGCDVVTVYALDRRDPRRLRITTTVTRREPGARLFAMGDVALQTQHALRPFAFDTRGHRPADGFALPAIDVASALSVAAATTPADTRILVGAQSIEPGIAYAMHATRAERKAEGADAVALPIVSLSAETFSGLAAFAAPFWSGGDRLGLLQMLQTLWIDLPVGETLVFEREIRVSTRADVASLTDFYLPDTQRVHGRVDDANASLVVVSDAGLVTQARPDATGAFAFSVPSGAYRLDVLGSAGGATQLPFRIGDGDVDLGAVAAPPRGSVALPRGAAMRLTFLGEDGTPDPRFGDARPAVRFGDETPPSSTLTRNLSLTGIDSDPSEIALAPGSYRVLAGRGPEFGVTEAKLEVKAGERSVLTLEAPQRAVETPGWISADLHVHAAPSDDSALPLALRVANYVAEGDEVLVATDHDVVTDYGLVIRELQLASAIASVVGQEVTSSTSTPEAPHSFGHANAFPLTRRPLESRAGAIRSEGRRLREVVADVRALGGSRILQLNHPRGRAGEDIDQHFFEHLSVGAGFDPRLPLQLPPNAVLLERGPRGTRDLDFDAMELLNGPSLARYQDLREDWFALLRQGIIRTATANSDSHVAASIAAAPRNLVRTADDPANFDEAAFVDAIRAGRVVGTTGPILDASVGDARIGDLHHGKEGAIRVDVHAAPWIPVAKVRAYVNGELAHETDASQGMTVWFPHSYDRDAFVTVEVEGEPDALYSELLPGFTPFAFTNPIYVDADGDGKWTAQNPLESH
jgi:hypothetical protein